MGRGFRRILAAALFFLAPAVAALPCVSGTLEAYIALGSCEIGDTSFSGFETLADLPADAMPIAASDIQVVPLAPPADPGFLFDMDVSALAGELWSVLFRFQVSGMISGARAVLSGAAATGDGVALLVEDLCIGAMFATPPSGCAGDASVLIAFADASFSEIDVTTAFVKTALLDVVANPIVDGGPDGTATLGSVSLSFVAAPGTAVAEPPTPILFLSALVLLVAFTAHARRALA